MFYKITTLKKHTHPLSVNGKSSRQGATSSSYDSGSHHNTSATSDTLDSDDDVLPSERSPKVGLIKPSRIIPVYVRAVSWSWPSQDYHHYICVYSALVGWKLYIWYMYLEGYVPVGGFGRGQSLPNWALCMLVNNHSLHSVACFVLLALGGGAFHETCHH